MDIIPEESEKLQQLEEQHQLVSDRLQQQRLILVEISLTIIFSILHFILGTKTP